MASGPDGRWVAGIGDPSPMGWITVAAYAVAGLLALRNLAAAKRTAVPTGFWLALALLMFSLGINKQLDLQTWFGQTGRDMAVAQGWYAERRVVQVAFIVLLGVGAVVLLWWARQRWSALWAEYRWCFVGVALLLVFIVVRAATFHHIDAVVNTGVGIGVGAITVGRALEILGVLAVAAACAYWHAMHKRRVRRFAVRQAVTHR